MSNGSSRSKLRGQYRALSYLLMLVNMTGFLKEVTIDDAATAVFVAAVYLTYGLIYLLPAFALVMLGNAAISWRGLDRLFTGREWIRSSLVCGGAWIGFSVTQTFIFADRFIFHMFGFHVNGFVINLVTTKGGIDSMGGGDATTATFAAIVAGIFAIELALVLVLKTPRLNRWWDRFASRRLVGTAILLALIASVGERVAYGYCNAREIDGVTAASTAFPFYQPLTYRGLAKKWGFLAQRDPLFHMKAGNSRLQYPRNPIVRTEHPRYNIVWLVAESLRADMLDPEIMPHTWAMAEKSTRFLQHYSGGNGTRMGVFSLFYGLYGNYWFPLLQQQRGPVVMDLIIEDGYQYELYTGSKFSYPEFDKTVFARVPAQRLHENTGLKGWEQDRVHVGSMLDFIEKRDPARPFMTFMFFESPHSNYYFPPESVIRPDYLPEMNYATMNIQRDLPLIKNRYINAVHNLDIQLGRITTYLAEKKLLDSTIVIITGDHGEEFMEKGRWGHNSAFTEEQVRVPMVLWVPGRKPAKVARMTSHLDLAATLLPMLGVTNPVEDYCLGVDLLGSTPRHYTVLSDWGNVCYVDGEYKAVFPLNAAQLARQSVTTRDDGKVEDKQAFFSTRQPRLIQVMKDLNEFGR
jgi:membrane-anchored protein YejM (alkaline phosphatase superfamily)